MTAEKNVGEKIRHIREIRKVSLEDLAERSGMEISMVQQIEQGKNIPSLAPLIKIARALGVRLGTFLDDVDSYGPVVVRSGEHQKGARFTSQASAAREHLNFFSLAFDKAGRNMEPFIVEIEPGKQSDFVMSSHEGEEFIFVLDGEIEISYGKEVYYLVKGDSIYLDSIVLHNVHSGNHHPARVLAVVYAPF
jgi:transcriptional regulator with XRE-family HTH domain